jgi:hypothetical protein
MVQETADRAIHRDTQRTGVAQLAVHPNGSSHALHPVYTDIHCPLPQKSRGRPSRLFC